MTTQNKSAEEAKPEETKPEEKTSSKSVKVATARQKMTAAECKRLGLDPAVYGLKGK